ncbi:hypothetical protein HZS_262 [Henneguya salminicola]|nr:hypothetical protein HZS_262 [Henneguya salminicola]
MSCGDDRKNITKIAHHSYYSYWERTSLFTHHYYSLHSSIQLVKPWVQISRLKTIYFNKNMLLFFYPYLTFHFRLNFLYL